MTPEFTADWVSVHAERWREALGHLVGKPGVLMAEIGSYEGRSALWFVEHILTGGGSALFCIDPWGWGDASIELRFDANTAEARARNRIVKVKAPSTALEHLVAMWDAIYIDGDHNTEAVFADAARAWPRLAEGGILIFDDYAHPEYSVAAAVDSFLELERGSVQLLERGWQVIVKKTGPGRAIAPCAMHGDYHLAGATCPR